jgi:hypothetical protein
LQLGYQDQQFLSVQGFHVFKGTHGRNLAQILRGCKTRLRARGVGNSEVV